MFRVLLAILLIAVPLAAQLPASQAQSLYQEAAGTLERSDVGLETQEQARAIVRRLNTPLGWNNTADVYALLQLVRTHQPPAGPTQARDDSAIVNRLNQHFEGLLRAVESRVRNPDPANTARYAADDRRLGTAVAGEKRIVFLGDSITAQWKLSEYFPGSAYVNRGIGGQTTGEILQRVKTDVVDLQPAGVLVLAGINDLVHEMDVATAENNLSMIGDLARANNISVMFASILPVRLSDVPANRLPISSEAILEINAWLRELCHKKNYIYVDYFSAMAGSDGLLRRELTVDGVHLNRAGYRIMKRLAEEAIAKALAAPLERSGGSPRGQPVRPADAPPMESIRVR